MSAIALQVDRNNIFDRHSGKGNHEKREKQQNRCNKTKKLNSTRALVSEHKDGELAAVNVSTGAMVRHEPASRQRRVSGC
mmetsp:Transcript_57622/g.93236  ORF Transcript_57622/g.93236 Transcript_57622/m.93236 type:complete len:80 (-) Transcript_57622:118-357(-)